jgi:hypothetical protein
VSDCWCSGICFTDVDIPGDWHRIPHNGVLFEVPGGVRSTSVEILTQKCLVKMSLCVNHDTLSKRVWCTPLQVCSHTLPALQWIIAVPMSMHVLSV